MIKLAIAVSGGLLTGADYAMFARSGITKDTADRALVRRVDNFTGAEIVGRNGSGDYSGLSFPYIWPGEDWIRQYRLRRDHPEIEDGKPKNKYVSAPGSANMLYFTPETEPDWLRDAKLPIVLTEGEKKCLALHELGWFAASDAAERPRWLAVAISGVWNWRGRIGKITGPNGERLDETGPIPDLSRIEWKKRTVKIIFDSNVNSNEQVKIARLALAKHLRGLGAKVLFVDIPAEPEINGVDDLISVGPERVLDLIANAYDPRKRAREERMTGGGPKWDPAAVPVQNNEAPERRPSLDERCRLVAAAPTIGDILLHRYRFAKNEGDELYVYRDGAYRSDGSELVRSAGRGLTIEWQTDRSWKSGTCSRNP